MRFAVVVVVFGLAVIGVCAKGPDELLGKWHFVSSDNFDSYLKQVGVGFITRMLAAKLKPVLEFKKDGEKWTMISTSTFKTVTVNFVLGKEFEDVTADGRNVKSMYVFKNGKLIEDQKSTEGGENSVIERFVDENGKLVIIMTSGDVVAKRVYQKA
ncbi:hypothetical protein L596_019606 [Steinernema carpocapsae]|uniref:Cytosolic fatty-acid binding proteins domain-containing protein n=1 Tax=Steinernema carpocapsae TaxID=34508 RepID=A0A4U5MRU5_STECR|nr:hypothetical protein L596_019606 [Steinernema carpocapsae]